MGERVHSGGCQCGAVRFEGSGTPRFVALCHCVSCRRATGAAFSTWVGFRDPQVRWLKEPPSFHASSSGVRRGYCPRCGTPLSYAGDKWAGETHFLLGVFDDPAPFRPTIEVFEGEALPWARGLLPGIDDSK